MRRRGPYKLYLEPGSTSKMSPQTKRSREMARQLRQPFHVHDFEMEPDAIDEVATDTGGLFEDLALSPEPELSPTGDLTDEEPNGLVFNYSDDEADSTETAIADNGIIDAEVTDDNVSQSLRGHTFQDLLNFLDEYGSRANFTINYNIGEVLLMVLTLSLIHNLSLSCMCDMMKLLNVIYCTSLFPSTPYLFKKLLNPARSMKIHYTCENCGDYLGFKDENNLPGAETQHSLICSNCQKENRFNGYRYDASFVTLDIKSQVEDVLKDPKSKIFFNRPEDNNVYSDISSGEMYKRKVPNCNGTTTKYITCTFNIDGSPISKDAKTTITPIFLMINELDYTIRSKNLVLAGMWYGKEKPRMDVFLGEFTKQMNELSDDGFSVNLNNETIKIKILPLCCCVDTIARAQVQGIKSVNGYYCCSWCQLRGKNISVNHIKYPKEDIEPTLRTENNFQVSCERLVAGETDPDILKGVNNVSPFLELNFFSIIWGFCPDVMHLAFLGISFRFMELWLSDTNFEGYIGAQKIINTMDVLIGKIRAPKYLKRIPVALTLRRVMKSRELENWFLFYSIPLLKGHLPRKYFRHWKLVVQAIRTLLQDEVTKQEVDTSENMLYDFVFKTEQYYGEYEMTYNMHQLLHLAESVRRWGPLWAHTAYPFEASLGNVKSVLKATTGVPQQIFRNIEINQACNIIINNHKISESVFTLCEKIHGKRVVNYNTSDQNEIFLGTGSNFSERFAGLPANLAFLSYRRVIRNGITYSVKRCDDDDKKTDNSYVELFDGSYGQILKLLCSINEPKKAYVVIEKLMCENDDILTHTKTISGKGQIVCSKFAEIKCVAVHVFIDEYNDYISSIPMKHYALNL